MSIDAPAAHLVVNSGRVDAVATLRNAGNFTENLQHFLEIGFRDTVAMSLAADASGQASFALDRFGGRQLHPERYLRPAHRRGSRKRCGLSLYQELRHRAAAVTQDFKRTSRLDSNRPGAARTPVTPITIAVPPTPRGHRLQLDKQQLGSSSPHRPVSSTRRVAGFISRSNRRWPTRQASGIPSMLPQANTSIPNAATMLTYHTPANHDVRRLSGNAVVIVTRRQPACLARLPHGEPRATRTRILVAG